MIRVVHFIAIKELARGFITQERVILEAVPQLFDHFNVLFRPLIAIFVRMLSIEVEVMRRSFRRRSHDVPACTAAGD